MTVDCLRRSSYSQRGFRFRNDRAPHSICESTVQFRFGWLAEVTFRVSAEFKIIHFLDNCQIILFLNFTNKLANACETANKCFKSSNLNKTAWKIQMPNFYSFNKIFDFWTLFLTELAVLIIPCEPTRWGAETRLIFFFVCFPPWFQSTQNI